MVLPKIWNLICLVLFQSYTESVLKFRHSMNKVRNGVEQNFRLSLKLTAPKLNYWWTWQYFPLFPNTADWKGETRHSYWMISFRLCTVKRTGAKVELTKLCNSEILSLSTMTSWLPWVIRTLELSKSNMLHFCFDVLIQMKYLMQTWSAQRNYISYHLVFKTPIFVNGVEIVVIVNCFSS